jgi:hypothetical protein
VYDDATIWLALTCRGGASAEQGSRVMEYLLFSSGMPLMLLSVLMPSNRDLNASQRSIETALRYCEKQDALLIVSDNSRDPKKRKLLEGASPRLRYVVPREDGLQANLFNVYAAAESEFILMIGDDDELFVSPKDLPLDLATLDPKFLGVRPMTAVANSEGRIVRVKDYGIEENTPSARVMAYNEKAGGDNSAYYSIFRRKPFIDLHRFYFNHHPLKAGYCDWALATTMFASGKMIYDPGTIFKYNNHNWDKGVKIEGGLQSIYREVGLPADSGRFSLLLLYLDLMIFALRRGSLLDDRGKHDLAENAGWPILENFWRKASAAPDAYNAETMALCSRLGAGIGVDQQFEIALQLADQLQPGLTERYRAFHKVSLAA